MNPSQRKKPKKPIFMGSNSGEELDEEINTNNVFFDSVERYNCIEENDNKYALEFYAYMSNTYKLTSEELSKHFLGLCKNAIKSNSIVHQWEGLLKKYGDPKPAKKRLARKID